ncbi:MAG: GAF domain-containing protein [Gammaproteobacteria bacterium]|nr:GAF domain-containing protein [Gammaproteobacteria bacterium]
MMKSDERSVLLKQLRALNDIGAALSSEPDSNRLLEKILTTAKSLTFADGGVLYTKTEDALKFEVVLSKSLNLHQGGASGVPVSFPPLPLYDGESGKPNLRIAVVCAAIKGETINIADGYKNTEFEFPCAKALNELRHYRSESFLTVPMTDSEKKVIGVIQLINAIDPATGRVHPFTELEQQLVESLASQAAMALVNQRLLKSKRALSDLNKIGVALSVEKDDQKLLQMILEAARNLTNADGGTLYSKAEEGLKFEILLSQSLKIHQGGTSGNPVSLPMLPFRDEAGKSNHQMVAVHAALTGKTVNIPDAYTNREFEFSGTRKFDESMKYRSQSFLTVPMKDHEGLLIGVLQLINATDKETGNIHPFTQSAQDLVESLASQAAVALVNQRLLKEQRHLFDSFIELIASAIDNKSAYTGGHCRRVPTLALMLADAVAKTRQGPPEIVEFSMTEEQRYELKVASLLHDCGKITTKEYVVDKATKLETIFDRIHDVDNRFEILKRDAEITLLRERLAAREESDGAEKAMREKLEKICQELDEERDFLRHCNLGGEFMSQELKDRVKRIAKRRWTGAEGKDADLLSEDELKNLTITKGTLTEEERKHINYHISATIDMLQQLPYPRSLKRVPEFAGGHHERMDGKGYPNGLTRDQMSLQARIMGIADVFEALTAADRPYKKAMPLSLALTILGKMKEEGHIDPDLFDVFVREKLYLQYAENLKPEQIDEVDVSRLPIKIMNDNEK